MTSDVTDAPVAVPDILVRAGLDATYQHISLLYRKRALLRSSQIAAEEQFLHRVSQLYAAGAMTEMELAFAYRAYADYAVTGFMKRWGATVSVPAGRMQYLLRDLATRNRHVPNMPDGTWRGTWPLDGGSRVPASGTCVVYVLYDGKNVPCYVGSTKDLKARLKWHADDGKPFVCWSAFRCQTREAAYRLEEKLLAEHQPYLNKKRYR